MINKMSLLNNLVFKNSDKFGRCPFICNSVSASKKEKYVPLKQYYVSQRHKLPRSYKDYSLKILFTVVPHQAFQIQNKKQPP